MAKKNKNDSLIAGVQKTEFKSEKANGNRHKKVSESSAHNAVLNAEAFVEHLRDAGYGVTRWDKMTNKHFQAVADEVHRKGNAGDARIEELFTAARKCCRYFDNDRISDSNATFGLNSRDITNQVSKGISEEYYQEKLEQLHNSSYKHSNRASIQFEMQYHLGLRREEAAKVDVYNDIKYSEETGKYVLEIRQGSKNGRPRDLTLTETQLEVLERAKEYASPSNIEGRYNLMPEGMGDKWLDKMDRSVQLVGMTKKMDGYTQHNLRHSNLAELYKNETGFYPPNKFESIAAFQAEAAAVAAERNDGKTWQELDKTGRQIVCLTAGHGKNRVDIGNAYLGRSE